MLKQRALPSVLCMCFIDLLVSAAFQILFLSLSFICYVNYNLIGDRTRMNTISSAIVGYGETVPRSSGDRVRKEHICFAGRGKRSSDVSFR